MFITKYSAVSADTRLAPTPTSPNPLNQKIYLIKFQCTYEEPYSSRNY